MAKRILVPLDGSDLAEAVLPFVQDIVQQLKGEVYFIQVVGLRPELTAAGVGTGTLLTPHLVDEQLEAETKEAEAYLSSLAHGWQAKGITTRSHVIVEPILQPATAITAFARGNAVDIIAMSTHGRSGLKRMIFGSVAEEVVRAGVAPVVLIRPKRPERNDK